MPLERVLRRLIAAHYPNLAAWTLAEMAVVFCLVVAFEGMSPTEALVRHGPIILVGVAALNLDVYFVLSTWDHVRGFSSRAVNLLGPSDVEEVDKILNQTVFSPKELLRISVTAMALGELTFVWLGVNLVSPFLKASAFLYVVIVFLSLGYVIATATGVWRAVYRISHLPLRISPFHPDRVGGTEVIGRLVMRVFGLGSLLVLTWALAAYFAPYADMRLKPLAYLWILMAMGLLIYSLFGPSYAIHRALVDAKTSLENELARLYDGLYASVRPTVSGGGSFVASRQSAPGVSLEIVREFEEKVTHLHVWPYPHMVRAIGAVVLGQAATMLLSTMADHKDWLARVFSLLR